MLLKGQVANNDKTAEAGGQLYSSADQSSQDSFEQMEQLAGDPGEDPAATIPATAAADGRRRRRQPAAEVNVVLLIVHTPFWYTLSC